MPKPNINDENYYDYVCEAFSHEAKKDTDKLAIASLLIGGGIWAMSGNVIAGVAVAGGILVYSDRAIRQSNRALEFIQKNHVAAPFLPPDRLRDFEQTFGRETAVSQLRQAQDYGLRIAPAAEDCLEKWASGGDSQSPAALPAANSPTAPNDGTAVLNALTAAPLQPCLITGLPGSGKGILAALSLNQAVQKGARYWVLTPKPDVSEAGYWQGAERLYLSNRLDPEIDMFANLISVLDEFAAVATERNNAPGNHPPFILLLDEVGAIVGGFTPTQKQQYRTRINALSSMLRSANMAVWIMGASATLEDLGITGKQNRAVFNAAIAVAEKRDGLGDACKLLGITAPENLPPGRWWLTQSGQYAAIAAPEFPTYPSWDAVPNLIDLRPDPAPVQTVATEPERKPEPQASAPPPSKLFRPGDTDRATLEKLFSLPDDFAPSPAPEKAETVEPNSELEDVANYVRGRGECPVSAVKNWGKTRRKGALNSDEVEELLIELTGQGKIESFYPDDSKAQWVRWIPSR